MNDSGPLLAEVIEAWETRLLTDAVVQAEVGGRIRARGSVVEIQQPGMYWTITSGVPTEVFRENTIMWELWTVDTPTKSAVRSCLDLNAAVDRLMTRHVITLPLIIGDVVTMQSVLEASYESAPGSSEWYRMIMRYRYTLKRRRPVPTS